jgi:Large polyvalent protein associated domain 38
MSDFTRIRDNVQKMVDQQAPADDINGYLSSEGFTPPEFKLANENYGTFMSAVKRSGKNIGSLLADFLPAMGADLLEKIAPDSFKPQIEAYKQRQLEEAAATQEEIAKKYPAQYESFEQVTDPLAALGYAKEAAGEVIPSLLPGIVTGGVGSVLSRGAIGAAGQIAAQQAKNRVLATAPAAAIESGAAETLAAKAAIKAAEKAMATKTLQAQAVGAYAGSAALTIPDAYQAIYSETGKTELLPALGAGLFNAALDAVTPVSILRAAKGKGLTESEILGAWYLRGMKGAVKGAAAEGLTEGLQEVTNTAAVKFVDENKEIFTPENFVRFIDSTLKGAIGGGLAVGATSAAFGKKEATPRPEETTQFVPPPGAVPTTGQGVGLGVAPEPSSPLTGERDLAGMVPKGAFYKPTEEMEPIIGPDGKITGYQPARQVKPRAELEGEQLGLPISEQGELPLTPREQPIRKGELRNIEGELIYPEELKNVKGEPLAPDADLTKPIGDYVKSVVEKAKQDTSASKLLKANNPATAKIVADRIEKLLASPDADPIEAMEQLYEQDKTGRYPAGTKALSDAQRELLQTIYRRRTGRDIEDAIRDRAFAKAQQGELFPEGDIDGTKQGAGQGELFPGTAGTDVGTPSEGPGAGVVGEPAGGATGAPGVGVGGGELPPAGGVGGVGAKPSALTPEEAWNRHKNDDHPAFTELSPEEQAAWGDLVARGRDTAPNFQDLVEGYTARTTRQPEEIKRIFEEEKKITTADIESELAGKDFKQLLDFMTKNGPISVQEVMKKVAEKVELMRKKGFDFTFTLVQTPGAARRVGLSSKASGHVSPVGKTMNLVLAGRGSGRIPGNTFEVAAHELLHTVTIPLIRYGSLHPTSKEGKIVQELEALSDHVKAELKKRVKNGTATYFEEAIINGTNVFGKKYLGSVIHKADEMVSWGMTNSEYRGVLESIPYKGKTVLDAFVETIRKLIGLAPKAETALSEIIRLSNELFQMQVPASLPYFSEPVTYDSEFPIPSVAASEGPSVVPQPGQPYTLPKLTKLQPAPTAKQSIIDTTKKITNAYNDSNWWTKFRIAAVDPTSGLANTLKSLPVFQNGQLRADMLVRAFNQVINLIKNGIQSGIPVINSDGTVIIQRDANNLARSQVIADSLDNNATVKGSGFSGRGYVAEIARILRGQEIMQVDAHRRFKAGMAFQEAERKMQEAKRLQKQGRSITEVTKLVNEAKAIRRAYRKDLNANREKQVTQAHIDWANQQLKAVPQAQEILDIWGNVNQGLITLWENSGLLTKQQADYYRSMKNYVPLYAAREDLPPTEQEPYTGSYTGGTKTVRELDHLEGTDLQRNIWENIDKHYASMTAAAFQNQTRKVAAEQLESVKAARVARSPDDPQINLRYRDPTNPMADKNGVMHMILDNPNDLAAFQMMHYELGPLMKGLSATTQVLRGTALINPMYWIRQLIRDPIQASLVANSGIVTPFHTAAEYTRVLAGQSEEARILATRGVIGQIDSTVDLQDFLKQVGTEKVSPSKLDELIRKVMRMHESSDAATRVAIFKKARDEGLRRGMSAKEAEDYGVFRARESINFAVRGNSKTLNALRHMIPFFSATIVSLDTLYRAATGYGLNPQEKAEAQRLFYSRALMMALLSTAYAMMLQDDEDYKKLPDNVKDNNWLMPNPFDPEGRTFIKIAIPYEVGFLFKTVPEIAVRYMADTSTGKEVLASFGSGLKRNLPGEGVLIPQGVKPALEAITNYSFFTGRPIEGMSDQGLPVAQRGPNASEISKLLSSYGLDKIGLSPAKIDYLIGGYTAELGTFTTGIASAAVNAATGKEPPAKNLEQQPFFRAFLTNPNTSKAASDFYEISNTAQETVNAFNRMKKEGRVEAIQEFMTDEEKVKLMKAAPALRKVQEQMANIRRQINIIKNNEKLDPEVRRDRINELMTVYDKVARQGYKVVEAAKIER